MARNLDDIFNECYERIRSGESLESCLRSYPQYRTQLEPLLRTTFDIGRRVSYIQPRPEFKHWAYVRFESAMRYPRQQQQQQTRGAAPAATTWLRHGWAVIVSVGIVILLGTGSTMAASSQALPNEPMYPVKLATEQMQRVITVTPERKAEFETEITNRRAAELEAMANAGDTAEATMAAVRYDDQFQRAIDAIVAAGGFEYVPPEGTQPPAVTAPTEPTTTPTETTTQPTETTTQPTEVTTPPDTTPTPPETTSTTTGTSDNATPTESTIPEETTTPESTTPAETVETTTPEPEATETAPIETDEPTEVTTPAEPTEPEEAPTETTTPPKTTKPTTTKSSTKAEQLKQALEKSKEKSLQALKDAKDKAAHEDKGSWQNTIDNVSKKTTKGSSGQDSDKTSTTTKSDNKATTTTKSDNKTAPPPKGSNPKNSPGTSWHH